MATSSATSSALATTPSYFTLDSRAIPHKTVIIELIGPFPGGLPNFWAESTFLLDFMNLISRLRLLNLLDNLFLPLTRRHLYCRKI